MEELDSGIPRDGGFLWQRAEVTPLRRIFGSLLVIFFSNVVPHIKACLEYEKKRGAPNIPALLFRSRIVPCNQGAIAL